MAVGGRRIVLQDFGYSLVVVVLVLLVVLACFWPHVVYLQEYDVNRLLLSHYDTGKTRIERQ